MLQEIVACQDKFPQVRFSVIRIKRKKCLLAIDKNRFPYNGSIAKESYEKTVNDKILNLRENLSEYMK